MRACLPSVLEYSARLESTRRVGPVSLYGLQVAIESGREGEEEWRQFEPEKMGNDGGNAGMAS